MKPVLAFAAIALVLSAAVFGQDQTDSEATARLAAAQAALNAKSQPATQPANLLAAGSAAANKATTQPAKSVPSIAGVWQGGDDFLTITQTNGTWTTDLTYKSTKDGEISWEIKEGTITTDGKLSGKLHYTKAPDTWGKFKTFHAKLSKDGKTITGPTWENHAGTFTWTATDPTIPLAVLKAMAAHTLAVGMTLEQCNKAIGSAGRVTSTDGGQKTYEWDKGMGGDLHGHSYIPFIGTIGDDDRLVGFEQEASVYSSYGMGESVHPGELGR